MITIRIVTGSHTLMECPCVCLEKWAVRKMGTNILLICETHKERQLIKCYLWFVGVTFARLGSGCIGIVTCIVVVWANGHTRVGSTAVEMTEEISRIIRNNREELKEVTHVGNSHSPGYTWHCSDTTVLGLFVCRQQQKITVLERHWIADEGNEVVLRERCCGKSQDQK
jgi:hypothetical protein